MTATTKAASSGGSPLSNQFAATRKQQTCGHPTSENFIIKS